MTYRIRLKESLSERWHGVFGGLELRSVQVGDLTVSELSGSLDSSELQEVLAQLCNLNLHPVSVDAFEEGKRFELSVEPQCRET